MKTKDLITEIYQQAGLRFINLLTANAGTLVTSDVSYGDKPRNKLDYYQLEKAKPRGTVLFYYGGNWRSGSKSDYRFVADTLLMLGFDVIIPDYRHYPEVRFSDIQSDAVNATRWALNQLRPEQPFFILGHSAGAQLGALLCLNEKLLGRSENQRIQAFIGLAGPYDFYPFTEDDHWDLFAPPEAYPESQPVNYVRDNAAPMYLLHGESDTRVRRGHSKSLMEKCQESGGLAIREVYPGMGHVDIVLQFTRLHRGRSKVIRDIGEFLTAQLIDKVDFEANSDAVAIR